VPGNAPSLAEDPGFSAAFSRVPAGHLGAVYLDLQSLGSLIEMGMAEGMTAFGEPMDMEQLLAQLPEDMVAYLAAGEDRMTLEAFITAPGMLSSLPVGESELATLFPADTQIYVETRDLGSVLAGALGSLIATMDEESAAEMAPIEDMLGVPLPQLLDFVSDAGIGAGLTSDGLWLASPPRSPTGRQRSHGPTDEHRDRLGASAEAGISVETEAVGDPT
jgi:hypothetical protein